MPPATYIVQHPKEKRSKCTVWPLREHPDIIFLDWPLDPADAARIPDDAIRLGIDGPELAPGDEGVPLVLLDGTWRLAERMRPDFLHLPVRRLPAGLRTAYPRTSKIFDDPQAGLASVEALHAAWAILGRPVEGLLDHYHWREGWLESNAEWLEAVGRG